MAAKDHILDIEGKQLKVTNLDKALYPAAGFTKGEVIDYYIRVSPVLLPHLQGRPLTLKRYPNGVDEEFFYEKNCPKHRPDWVATAPVWSEGNQRYMDYCMVQDVPTLVWAANLAALELHTSLSVASDILRPTMAVFDLDPGEPANIAQCCRVALLLKSVFDRMDLQSFAKTSGSKGLQVYVPLNTQVTYEETKLFAHTLARLLESDHPSLVVSDMKKSLRAGKVFVDWSQNDDHKTTVCVYSLRAKQRPTVSAPVTWDEVDSAARGNDQNLLVFESQRVVERVQRMGDLFAPVFQLKQTLPDLRALSVGKADETLEATSEPEERRITKKKTRSRISAGPRSPAVKRETGKKSSQTTKAPHRA